MSHIDEAMVFIEINIGDNGDLVFTNFDKIIPNKIFCMVNPITEKLHEDKKGNVLFMTKSEPIFNEGFLCLSIEIEPYGEQEVLTEDAKKEIIKITKESHKA